LSAADVAQAVNLAPESVFKTLLVRVTELGPCFAVIPATGELDLKALAHAAQKRGAVMVPLKDVTALTGYVRGGVTALAAKKKFPVFLDESALAQPHIAVSAGIKGLQIVLAPEHYRAAAHASVAQLCEARTAPA